MWVNGLCQGRSGGSMGCVMVGRVGRWVVFGWVDWLCSGRSCGSMGCVRLGRVGRWVVPG